LNKYHENVGKILMV